MKTTVIALSLILLAGPVLSAGNRIDLSKEWRFAPDPEDVGIAEGWFSPTRPDEGWATIDAGKRWEDQGFPEVDGVAWYRKWVDIPPEWEGSPVWLVLGGGNDAYTLYCNGQSVNAFGDELDETQMSVMTVAEHHSTAAVTTVAELGPAVVYGKPNLLALRFYDWGGSGGPWRLPFYLTNDPKEAPSYPEIKTYVDYAKSEMTVEVDLLGLGRDHPPGLAQVKIEDLKGNVLPEEGVSSFEASQGALQFVVAFSASPKNRRCKVEVTVVDSDGRPLVERPSTTEVELLAKPSWDESEKSFKVLNNFVTQLADISLPRGEKSTNGFENPRDGWVFVSFTGGPAAPEVVLDDGPDSLVFRKNPKSGELESMRRILKGPHALTAESAEGGQLMVRTIPELAYTYYPTTPHIKPHGTYDWGYLEKYVLPHVNTLVTCGGVSDEIAESWVKEGRQWLGNASLPGLSGPPPDPEEVYKTWAGNVGVTDPRLGGMIVDEFISASPEHYGAWTVAFEKLIENPLFGEKVFYAFCGDLYQQQDAQTRRFVETLMAKGHRFALERYEKEEHTLEEARRALLRDLQFSLRKACESFPGWEKHLVMCLGYLSAPPESLNLDPSVDYKVFMDMQFQLLATDPTFWGLYGVMEYTTSYADEEFVRWAYELYRHYCIDGNTEPLTKDPYALAHLKNPDFELGLDGWRAQEADPSSVGTDKMEGFSFLQGRYPRTSRGDTFLTMKRSEKRPNKVTQKIENLEPGRSYSLKFITAAYKELDKEQELVVSAHVDHADLVNDLCFQAVFPSCYAHEHGPYTRDHPAYFNYHRLVFRPKGTTAELVFSDWGNDSQPVGPVGQALAINFVEVQPFLMP